MTEKVITVALFLTSAMYLFFAQQLTFGTLQSPKSGFLPIIAGIIAVAITLLLLIKQFQLKKIVITTEVDWTKFIFFIIGLLFYVLIFTVVGYFIATFIFLFYLFKIFDTPGWLLPFSIAITSSTVFHLLFKYYLAVTLP